MTVIFIRTVLLAIWKIVCGRRVLAIGRVVQKKNKEALDEISGRAEHRRG